MPNCITFVNYSMLYHIELMTQRTKYKNMFLMCLIYKINLKYNLCSHDSVCTCRKVNEHKYCVVGNSLFVDVCIS